MTKVDSQSKQNELLANVKFAASAATDEDLVAAAKSGDHPAFVEEGSVLVLRPLWRSRTVRPGSIGRLQTRRRTRALRKARKSRAFKASDPPSPADTAKCG
jgi:hypothetical protein